MLHKMADKFFKISKISNNLGIKSEFCHFIMLTYIEFLTFLTQVNFFDIFVLVLTIFQENSLKTIWPPSFNIIPVSVVFSIQPSKTKPISDEF